MKKDIILYINTVPLDAIEAIKEYGRQERQKFRVFLLSDSSQRVKKQENIDGIDTVLECDFKSPTRIAETLLPYQNEFLAISCRSEKSMAEFAQVIPHVPYLRTPTSESIAWATNKLSMRKRLALFDKKITPKFIVVSNAQKGEQERIKRDIGFPVILKPANLAQSLLVSICFHEEELSSTLKKTFRTIERVYAEQGRRIAPQVIAEQYMEGDMYSFDGYVSSKGTVHLCPLVKVVTGRSIGFDDFFNYMHLTPAGLKKSTVERAEEVARKATHALALRSTSIHIELMKIDDEWKVIELGARVGGFRHALYSLAYGINHSLNDILVRIPKRPLIPKTKKGYAVAMKFFPEKEGKLSELKGIKKIQEFRSFQTIVVNKKVGDRCTFAKHGGMSVFNLVMFNRDRSELLADIRRVEQTVSIKTE